MDYLILGFDAKGALTTLVWPILIEQDRLLRFGMAGYRDGLCELIPQEVESVDITLEEVIIIKFQKQTRIEIPLRTHGLPGDRAIFYGQKRVLTEW